MSLPVAMTSVPKPPAAIIEAFRNAPTSIISDNLARLPGAVGLVMQYPLMKQCGLQINCALTAK